ncbi:hypothetical protein [Micromonospora coerulea]|uniref:hypothetical protein n=1 Tax=Micromonospora coerulea TaxID=47856 RepID=UPI001F434C89|nr:hypothetical protein [Micromonospora veneta]
MIVVQVLRIFAVTDCADAALLGEKLLKLLLPYAVAPPQIIFAEPAMQAELALLALLVVARLAVSAVATPTRAVTGKVVQRLGVTAVGTAPMSIRGQRELLYLAPMLLAQSLGVAGSGARVEACLAVATSTRGAFAARAELIERLPLLAVAAAT